MQLVVCCSSPIFVLAHVLIAFKDVPSRVFTSLNLLETFLIYDNIFTFFLVLYVLGLCYFLLPLVGLF